MRYLLMALVATIFIFSRGPALADTSGLVRGTITLDGKPLAGVAVTLTLTDESTHLHASTDALGTFTIANVPFGRYTFVARHANAPEFSQNVDVGSDSIIKLAIELRLRTIGRPVTVASKGVGAAE